MSIQARRDVFQAIADPTRRQIISLIAREPLSLNAIADKFKISRPAISQQIKFLTECGMVDIRQQGRERLCVAKLEALNEVSAWVEHYREFWDDKLNSLDKYLRTVQKKKNIKNRK